MGEKQGETSLSLREPSPQLNFIFVCLARSAQMSDPLVTLYCKHGTGKTTWDMAKTVVDTSAEEAMLWFFDYCSSERMNTVHNLPKNPREILKTHQGESYSISTLILS